MEENKNFSPKKFWIGFIATLISTLLLAGFIFGLGVLATNGIVSDIDMYRELTDAFTVAGGAGIVIYLLSLLTGAGAFDIFGYSIKLVWYNTFHRNVRETALPKNYAEYKQIKRGKKPDSMIYMLLGSLPTLAIGIVFYILYTMQF